MQYNPKKIEKKWQSYWEKNKLYEAKDFSKKPKYYCLIEFPYPSGDGLHVGHVRSYTAMDIIARKRRMEGYNVLYPIGWDAFGLPTENYAIKTGIHPKIVTEKNIKKFKKQLKSLGLSFDWSREINTSDPEYYKWTQWIFLQFFKKGLAYQAKIPINWCPQCKIGLANEEVINGRCERCGAKVEQKEITQWLLKITKYADRLIKDLDKVNFLEKIKIQQINWIGKSYGTTVKFQIFNAKFQIDVFTTRVDTIFGVTAVVIAPEHPFVAEILKSKTKNIKEIKEYLKQSRFKSEFERTKPEKEKTGVFTGFYAINPINSEKVPIWIGDYVVASYGGGAVMVVPAHDSRDYEFAKKYGLEIKKVIENPKSKNKNQNDKLKILEEAFTEDGILINSGQFNGLSSEEAREKITDWLEKRNLGKKTVQYKLRDWIFSRQHYWGEPIPIIHCKRCGFVPVDEKDLPVKLPYVKKYQPTGTGKSPLANIKEWVNTKCPKCGGPAERETDTMPNWAGSSWYFLRYLDPKNKKEFAQMKKLKYWLPVDWYNGGMEHTTLHLLYSRFWHKFLFDLKKVPTPEPYQKRTSQGMVLGEGGEKMSKSRGNVVNPDDLIKEFGADALRLYEMFMGPFDQAISWDPHGIEGTFRFLNKVWIIGQQKINKKAKNNKLEKLLHQTIKKVSEDIEAMNFNTAISALMIFINQCFEEKEIPFSIWKNFLLILAPFAPHLTEELWQSLKNKTSKPKAFKSIHHQPWPKYDKKLIEEDTFELIIQINGKLRHKIIVSADISQKEAEKLVLAEEKIKKIIGDQKIKKIIFVPKRLINIVI